MWQNERYQNFQQTIGANFNSVQQIKKNGHGPFGYKRPAFQGNAKNDEPGHRRFTS